MLTRAQGRRQRKELDRQRAQAIKDAARDKLKSLALEIRRARATKGEHVRAARSLCKTHRALLIRRARERRARLLEELRETTKQERAAARSRCAEGKERARASALSRLEKARHALAHERAEQADLKRIEANYRESRRNIVRSSSRAERRSESDGEVVGNIPAELVPLWNRVGRRIKGSLRHSRTEAFLHYAAEHPREVIEAQESGIDATIRALEAKHARVTRIARQPRRRYTPEELADVPF